MNLLVTGGAGFIGSHMVRELVHAGHRVIVVDNLLAGHSHRASVPNNVMFVHADIRDRSAITDVLRANEVHAIFHFASRIQVGESIRDPRLYVRDNLAATIELLESALDANVRRFVFSSTAAVYGNPIAGASFIDEDHPKNPVNPYGETKLAIERILGAYDRAYELRFAALRYFNAAGANVAEGLGECHEPETHLVPLVIDAALGRTSHVTVFGDDYASPDGTCVRDYIHVSDLAEAHLAALDYLNAGGASGAWNLGTGRGHSVREVIDSVARVSGRTVPVVVGPRREGDPPVLVASPERAEEVLGFRAKRPSIDEIVRDAWAARTRT
jgi:UDP-glucose 4-epimerase